MSATPDNLSLADRLRGAELYEEFATRMFGEAERYADLLEWLEQHGISSSMGALSRFKDSHQSAWTIERAKRQHEATLRDAGVDLDEAQRKLVAERIFNLAASTHLTDKHLLKLRDQEIRLAQLDNDRRKLDMAERKIAALEAQVQAAEAALDKAVSEGGMTAETRAEIRKSLGMVEA